MKGKMAVDMTLLLPAILTIGCWTIVFRDNPLYKFIEATAVGFVGYELVNVIKTINEKAITPASGGDLTAIIGILLGILMLFRVSKKYAWLARPPLALTVGAALGLTMRGFLKSNLAIQLGRAAQPLTGTPFDIFNSLIMLTMTIGAIAYFIFTRKQTGPYSYLTKWGRIGLMAAWGAMYASTTTGRINYLIGRLQFLFYDFLGIVPS